MKRIALLVGILGVFGILGAAQCCPPPSEPPCYTAFWQGEDVCFELIVPFWGWCCCCPAPQVQVTGWRVVTMDGNVIYQETFATPYRSREMGMEASGCPGQARCARLLQDRRLHHFR
jgi:hypothetical protein